MMTSVQTNILISSAGRRVELVEAFQQSLSDFQIDGCVLATDMSPQRSSACEVADHAFQVPAATVPHYASTLLALCVKHNVKLVVPTIDTELNCLAENFHLFKKAGIHVAISDTLLIDECRDKRRTGKLFKQLGIGYPEIFPRDDLRFPCFCKPYDGSRSIGAKAIATPSELTTEDLDNPKNIFMELVHDSYCEYTVDGYYSKHGDLCALVCRERLEVRGGEVSKGVSRKDFVYNYLILRLKKLPGARGCITFQFFVNKGTGDIKGLEINPRFGGGYPLTHQSGARFTDYLVHEYLREQKVEFFEKWEADLLMLRYDAGIYKKYVE